MGGCVCQMLRHGAYTAQGRGGTYRRFDRGLDFLTPSVHYIDQSGLSLCLYLILLSYFGGMRACHDGARTDSGETGLPGVG